MITPFVFVAVVMYMRYLVGYTVDFVKGTFDFVEDLIALALDATDLVAYHFRTGYTHSHWSSSIITLTTLQLLFIGGFVAFLAYLSLSHQLVPPRQNLQELLDEVSRKLQVTQDTLSDWQDSTEKLYASNKELQKQYKNLQKEKEQVIAEKDSTKEAIAESEFRNDNLMRELEDSQNLNKRLERSRRTAVFSLGVAEKKVDQLEQACKAAGDEVLLLSKELAKAKKRAPTGSGNMTQSHEVPDHSECFKKAASQDAQANALLKAVKTRQEECENQLRSQATATIALREDLRAKDERHEALEKKFDEQTIIFESLQEHISCLTNQDASLQQAQADILGLKESLAAKEACLKEAQAGILDLKESLIAKNAALRQAQADLLGSEESLAAKDASLQEAQANLLDLEESLAAKDESLQEAQADILDFKESLAAKETSPQQAKQVEESTKVEKHQALDKQVKSLTVEINARQAKINQVEESLAAKDASLQQAQADILDLKEQVEELTASNGKAAGLESVKVKSQRDEIERLTGEVVALKAAYESREMELMEASAGAMVVDIPEVEFRSKETANLQTQVQQLQEALDQARVDLSAARLVGEEMDLEAHECDHTRCRQRELEQDVNFAKIQGRSLAQEKQISELTQRNGELEFRLQNLRATTIPQIREVVNSEAIKDAKEKADYLARARRDAKKMKEFEDSLRAKNLELKEVKGQLQVERVAAATRVEDTIRERMTAAQKAFEEIKLERDRCRTNNSSLFKRAAEAEKALTECQRQRDQSVAEAGRLMGELTGVQGGAGAANTKKREMEEEEHEGVEDRPVKISRPDA